MVIDDENKCDQCFAQRIFFGIKSFTRNWGVHPLRELRGDVRLSLLAPLLQCSDYHDPGHPARRSLQDRINFLHYSSFLKNTAGVCSRYAGEQLGLPVEAFSSNKNILQYYLTFSSLFPLLLIRLFTSRARANLDDHRSPEVGFERLSFEATASSAWPEPHSEVTMANVRFCSGNNFPEKFNFNILHLRWRFISFFWHPFGYDFVICTPFPFVILYLLLWLSITSIIISALFRRHDINDVFLSLFH